MSNNLINVLKDISKFSKTKIKAVMKYGIIKTNLPVSVKWEFINDMFVIRINNKDYAIIDYVSDPSKVNLKKVRDWINETYTEDYKSSSYIPARLKFQDFK